MKPPEGGRRTPPTPAGRSGTARTPEPRRANGLIPEAARELAEGFGGCAPAQEPNPPPTTGAAGCLAQGPPRRTVRALRSAASLKNLPPPAVRRGGRRSTSPATAGPGNDRPGARRCCAPRGCRSESRRTRHRRCGDVPRPSEHQGGAGSGWLDAVTSIGNSAKGC